MSRHPSRRLRPPLALTAAVVVAAGLVLFQPWKLVVDDVVDEAPPAGLAALDPASPTLTAAAPTPTGTAPTSTAPATGPAAVQTTGPTVVPVARVLARGTFVAHEHGTTGTVRVVALPDGRRLLRIDDLDTSNGPDLRVWITDAPVLSGRDGWRVFDDGEHVELGRLKGNRGSQNYALPESVDLRRLGSVTIWCARFTVSFGAAALTLGG